MKRTVLTCILILAYLLAANIFIYMLSSGMLDLQQRRLFHYYMTGSMALLCFIDLKTITESTYHAKFNEIAFCSLFANFILNILNHHGLLKESAANRFLMFNGLIFALTLLILINGSKHGTFKDKYEND